MELRKRRLTLGLAAAVALVGGGLLARSLVAQQRPAPAAPAQAPTPAQEQQGDLGGALIAALQHSPGCLGVDAGQMKSGKLSIFAWFKDKQAVLDWYASPAHQQAMGGMRMAIEMKRLAAANGDAAGDGAKSKPPQEKHTPLEFVPDGTGPILCIASITPSDKPLVPGFPMAIGQISIELYQPLPGGVSFGGTFAPAAMKIEHHRGDRPAVPADAPAATPAPTKGN